MMKESPADYLKQQKSTRQKIIDLLYKEDYCLCIPNSKVVQSLLNEVSNSWIQKFLMKKNPVGLSVIPMFMLIFLKNKLLNFEESQQLVNLIYLLINKLETADVDSLLFEKKINSTNMNFFYSLFNRLIQSELGKQNATFLAIRIQGVYKCLQLFIAKASVEATSRLALEPEENFHIIQQAMYSIACSSLSETQMAYVLGITKNLIYQLSQEVLDRCAIQRHEGFSLICYAIAIWLMVIKKEISECFKIECLTAIITAMLDKVSKKTFSKLLLQEQNQAISFSLTYIYLTELSEPQKQVKNFYDSFFIFWLEKIISSARQEQLMMIIDKTFFLLEKESGLSSLSYSEKHKIGAQFFSYVVRFANLPTEKRDQLDLTSKLLSEEFFSVHLSKKNLFNSLFKHFPLFKQNFGLQNYQAQGAINKNLALNEKSALITHAF